jgi:AAA domain
MMDRGSPEEFFSQHGTTETFSPVFEAIPPVDEHDRWYEQEIVDPVSAVSSRRRDSSRSGAAKLDVDRLIQALDAHAWANLDIPPTVQLLGDLVVPASRTFIVGTTGVGKTLIAYEIAAAMACGSGFLHWKCDRPSRVLILDGEMPDALIKRRIADLIGRHAIPRGNLILYGVSRGEKIEADAGLSSMPPLNTSEGHDWVKGLISTLTPEIVIFDNLMSLAPGNHAEPDTWLNVLPLVLDITKDGIAQVWCDHSGWDASRQYGSSTKAWMFDTVGILKPVPEEQREPHVLKVNLTFDAPAGKARRRTPDNWNDFEPKTLILRDGEWSSDGASTGVTLSPSAAGWLKDIVNIFRIPGLPKEATVSVSGVTITRVTLTRSQVRDWLRKCGRIGDGSDAKMTGADRQLLSKWLNKLRELGKIGIDGDYIWLTIPSNGDAG